MIITVTLEESWQIMMSPRSVNEAGYCVARVAFPAQIVLTKEKSNYSFLHVLCIKLLMGRKGAFKSTKEVSYFIFQCVWL